MRAILMGLVLLSSPVMAEKLWTEKDPRTKPLVALPSLKPIIDELDSTVVNISTMAEGKQKPMMRQRQRGQGDPFMDPEDFLRDFFGGQPGPQMPRRSMGSGFIISKNGTILTNNHVVDGADKVEVIVTTTPATGKKEAVRDTYEAKIIGRDPRTDVAILKIESKTNLPVAPLGNSDTIEKGDWVIAMGNPFGLDHSVSAGIVSAKGREITQNENRRFDDFIQTDAAINFGNSGGPLVNVKGEVIGINTAITAQGSGIGFAIPINQIKEILDPLLRTGSVARGYLGVMIQDVTEAIKGAMQLDKVEGVLVNDLVPDGPAAKSALKSGDVILKVDGEAIKDSRGLQRAIARTRPNQKVNLDIIRDKKARSVTVTLGALDEPEKQAKATPDGEIDKLGLIVGVGEDMKSVEIQGFDPIAPAAQMGVLPGDKITSVTVKGTAQKVESLKSYKEILAQLKTGDYVGLNLAREDGQVFVAFQVPAPEKPLEKGKN